MKRDKKEPLYRKEKKTGLQTRYRVSTGGDYRWNRNTKKAKQDAQDEVSFEPINGPKNTRIKKHWRGHEKPGGAGLGRDYTPLYMFLLSRVGKPWEPTLREARERLDKEEPIWFMVDLENIEENPYVRIGEGTYYSRLTVRDGVLVKVDPEAQAPTHYGCSCHTQTFNGKPYKYQRDTQQL